MTAHLDMPRLQDDAVLDRTPSARALPVRRVLMITSEWPTEARPEIVPFIVRQVEFVRRAGVEVDVVAFQGEKNPVNYMKAWARVQRALRTGRPDLIHAQFGQSALLPWPKRLPLVITFRGCDLQGVKGPDGRTTRAGRMLQRLCQAAARRADAVVVVSEHMKRDLPGSVAAHVIPSGLDFQALPLMDRGEARRRLGLPDDERLVLFVGNPASTRKRCDLARCAVDLVNERLPCRLVVAWGTSHADIPVYMNACDAFIFTSRQEGSPNVVKEALACNLPVVSVAVGDVPTRLQGVAGCEVCEDDQPETIAASLERVLRTGARIDGRKTVLPLDEALLTDQLLSIYGSVLAASDARKPAVR